MCELLGMCFNVRVTPSITFSGFRHRAESNAHGWGIAFYPDESALVYKEPFKATSSKLSEFLRDYEELQSKIFIGHVRLASKGRRSYKNTHPFQRELNGRDYVFAHNGTLHDYMGELKLGRIKPIGDTDSEYAFCYLLGVIEKKEISFNDEKDFDIVAETLKEINKLGKFNCIFSNGEFLFCYHDMDNDVGLRMLRRVPPYGTIKLLDEDWEIDLSEQKDSSQRGYIIATRDLTNESWESFQPGELKVFKDGEIIYSSK